MNRFTNRFVLLLGALSVLLGTQGASAKDFIVKYRNAGSIAMMSANSFQVMDQHETGNLLKVRIPKRLEMNAMVELLADPNVEYVVPNFTIYAFENIVEPTALKDQWALKTVQAEKAWAAAGNRGSRQVTVAVIDTGVDYNHQSLSSNMVPGYDYGDNDSDPMDTTSSQNPGHGTHCAGIIGSNGLVDGGTQGISPEVSILPLRFLDSSGRGDLNNAIKSIDYAISKKVQVISASWGAQVSESQARPLIEAVKRATDAGIIFVVAAANNGQDNDKVSIFPANATFDGTIAVAASDKSDAKPSWSNFGTGKVHVASPGDKITSTLPNNKYGDLSGTSMATPLVAGLVALVKAQDPQLKPLQIRSLLQASAAKVNIQTACDCRVDAAGAVDMIKQQKMFVSPFTGSYKIGDKVQFEAVYAKGATQFATSDASIATIDASGMLTAVKDGEATISVKDSAGSAASSYKIRVGKAGGPPGGNPPGGNPPGGGECPLGDAATCEQICQILPSLPWCTK